LRDSEPFLHRNAYFSFCRSDDTPASLLLPTGAVLGWAGFADAGPLLKPATKLTEVIECIEIDSSTGLLASATDSFEEDADGGCGIDCSGTRLSDKSMSVLITYSSTCWSGRNPRPATAWKKLALPGQQASPAQRTGSRSSLTSYTEQRVRRSYSGYFPAVRFSRTLIACSKTE
jgi:hypothetical protein